MITRRESIARRKYNKLTAKKIKKFYEKQAKILLSQSEKRAMRESEASKIAYGWN